MGEINTSHLRYPKSLYNLCLELFVSLIHNAADPTEALSCKLLQSMPPSILEDALILASWKEHGWLCDWTQLLTASIRAAVIPCRCDVLKVFKERCQALRQVLFLPTDLPFDPNVINDLPKNVVSVDFNGEYFHRGRHLTNRLFFQWLTEEPSSWIIEAESVLRSMLILRQKIPDYILEGKYHSLVELHLSTVKVSRTDLKEIIQTFPKLRLLRHYQLTSALYDLHVETWKQGGLLPQYKLRNLDADFSHVFALKRGLDIHIIKAHADAKPFPCDHCPARFVSKFNMKRHVLRAHTNGKS